MTPGTGDGTAPATTTGTNAGTSTLTCDGTGRNRPSGHGTVSLLSIEGTVPTRQESLLEALGYEHPAWMKDAHCRETPTVNFFPRRGESVEPALQVCGTCLVRSECLEWALADKSLDVGVLGGMSARSRINTRRLQQRRDTPVQNLPSFHSRKSARDSAVTHFSPRNIPGGSS